AQVLKGLGEAHSRGIIHRDIKPANIMLCERQGRANYVKILDFGLAKLVSGSSDITKQNVLGTPTCLSPEQIQGQKADQRVDVYAVGILFYYMLAGKLPFEADNDPAVLYKHVHEQPEPLENHLGPDNQVPKGVIDLIKRCLEKKPDKRPRDANEVVEGLIDQVPFSMFRLPRADPNAPRPEELDEPFEPTGKTTTDDEVIPASEIKVGAFPRAASVAGESGRHPAISSSIPQSAVASLQSQGYRVDNSAIYQDDDGRLVVPVTSEANDAARRVRNMRQVIAGLGFIAMALVLMICVMDEPKPGADAELAEVASMTPELVLDNAENLINQQKYAQAETILDNRANDFAADPKLLGRYDKLKRSIEIGRLYSQGNQLEAANDIEGALAKYEKLLSIDPTYVLARERVKDLKEILESSDAKLTNLVINANVEKAKVFVDGKEQGETPFMKGIKRGSHDIRVEKDGYEPFSITDYTIEGDSKDLEVKLFKKEGARPRVEEGTDEGTDETAPEPPTKAKKPRPSRPSGGSGGATKKKPPQKKSGRGGFLKPVK
ncbi:MAG: serine/threonine protein kinase, partial [Myxococcales bacterium]|nr:serine/threonine protein kinase [Myxococcales bacterium]